MSFTPSPFGEKALALIEIPTEGLTVSTIILGTACEALFPARSVAVIL